MYMGLEKAPSLISMLHVFCVAFNTFLILRYNRKSETMLYFKHSELVEKYHVSLKTVHNWIDASKQGKLELELFEQSNRTYIANQPGNTLILKNLSEQGKKYRNTRYQKVIKPSPQFYKNYSRRQIVDIISNLTIHREIPSKYNYFEEGAENWDKWVTHLSEQDAPNMIHNTLQLVNDSLDSIDALLAGRKKVNIIDLGVGNAMPVNGIIKHINDKGLLNRYIGVDISQAMLDVAEKNLKEWFGDDFKYEGHVRDFSFERFDDLLVDDMLDNEDGSVLNLVLLFGSTPFNFRPPDDALRVVYGSMRENDLLIFTCKPDTESSRQFFGGAIKSDSRDLDPFVRYSLDLLNIDNSLYDVETGFNESKRMRYIKVRLKTAITIEFEFERNVHRVSLEKGESVLLLRVWHKTAIETINDFEKIGFVLLRSNMTRDHERLLTISGIDTKSDYARP